MGPRVSAEDARSLYAAAVGPARDPEFVRNNVHGADQQFALLRQAVRFCKNRRIALDVGAHVGLWSIGLSQFFDRVIAFEPVLENYMALDQNIPQDMAAHMVALGADSRNVRMELPPGGNSGMWYAEADRLGPVAQCRLDEFQLYDVDFIKIDVEGLEGAVVRGGAATIERCQPLVFFEDNGLGPQRYEKWVDPKGELNDLGYVRLVRLQKNELWGPRSGC